MAAQRTQADHDQDRDEEQQRQPGVGALLRASRLRCGEELRDIAELLCIRYLYLEAIEAGRYHDLPGTTYAIGFIRAYAEHLGLDSEEVVRRFKAEQSTLRRQDELAFPTPVPESGIPKGAIVFVGLIVAGLAYGAWYLSSSEESGLADLIGPLPERLESLVRGGDGSLPRASGAGAPAEPDSETAAATAAPPETTTGPEAAPFEASPEPAESADSPAAEDSAPIASPTAEAPASTAEQGTDAPVASPAPAEPAETATAPAETGAPATEQPMTASPETAANATAAPAPEAPADMAAPAVPPAESDQPAAEPGSSEPAAGMPAPAAETASPAPETAPSENATPDEPMAPPEPETAPAETAPEEAAPQETAAQETAPAAPAPTEPATEPAPQNTAPPAAPAEESAETASAPADEAAGILIRAVDNSWVQIRDADSNETVVTRLLRAGEEITVEGRPGLILATGNAGGLEIVVEGKVVPSIGGPGTVRRNVALDIERLKAGTALP